MSRELRHRAKKYTRGSLHETTCRTCGKQYTTTSYRNQCRDCWRKHHGPKKNRLPRDRGKVAGVDGLTTPAQGEPPI